MITAAAPAPVLAPNMSAADVFVIRRPIQRGSSPQIHCTIFGARFAANSRVTLALASFMAALLGGFGSQQSEPAPDLLHDRSAAIAALERLIVTGEPHHNSHDAGELLQMAVDDAFRRGDTDIVRLAIRAAIPLVPDVSPLISSVDCLPSYDVSSRPVLNLPASISYEAELYASVDGGDYTKVTAVRSGRSYGAKLDAWLPDAARSPGFHHVRSLAYLTFKDDRSGESWTERRDLRDVTYALYDPAASVTGGDPRMFVDSAAVVSAKVLHPELPEMPFGEWLARRVVRTGDGLAPDWMPQYCAERTSEAGVVPASGDVCAVADFAVKERRARLWVRTGRVELSAHEPRWIRDTPEFQAITLQDSGDITDIASLPLLLDSDPSSWPTADVSVAPFDIDVTVPTRAGELTRFSVMVSNNGDADVHNALVDVVTGVSPAGRTASRRFVVDIVHRSSSRIDFEAAFPESYGVVVVLIAQLSEHSRHDAGTVDPTPEDACAFRVVNIRAAPADYVATLGDLTGCRGW
jgi:hypothetical protein